MFNQAKNENCCKTNFMSYFKTLKAIYSKVIFCDLITFHSKPFNYKIQLYLIFSKNKQRISCKS